LFLVFIYFYASSYVDAQSPPLVIEYFYKIDSTYPRNDYWVKENSGIEFKIKNINLFNHNININNSREDYVNVENNSTNLNSYNTLISIEAVQTNFLQEINQINSLEESLSQLIRLLGIYSQEPNDGEIFPEEINRQYNAIDNHLKSIKSIEIKTEWLNQAILYYNNLFILLQSEDPIEDLIQKRNQLTNFYFGDRIEKNGEIIRFTVAYMQINSLRQRVISNISIKKDYIQNIINVIKIIESLSDEEGGSISIPIMYKTQLELVKQASISYESRLERISTILLSDKIDNLANEIQKIYMSFDKDNFNVSIKEFDLENVDLVQLEVIIEPKSSALGYKFRKENFTTNIRTYGGLRYDVSAGLMFNFNLNDRSYFYDPTDFVSDTVRITQNADRNSFLPFIGSQLNIYINKPFKFPISPGFNIGLSTNLTDIRNYLGVCLVIGNKDRIVLSGGVVTGQIDVLSGQYETNNIYLRSDLPEIPEVIKSFRLGSYLSITYNLSSNKAKSCGESMVSTR
jgi:hypothetical protein